MNETEPKVDTLPESRLADAAVLCSDILIIAPERLNPDVVIPIRCFAVQKTDHADAAILIHP
jgi:hypothetical protein